MKKESFVRIINAIDAQYSKDKENAKLLEKVFTDSTIIPSYCDELTNSIIAALKSEMNDKKDSWIDYYIYELDFGRENDRLKANDKYGKELPLSTPENLYDLLENNNRQKDEKTNKI